MKSILFGDEAKKKIKQGIDLVADAVKITLGNKGNNVIYGKTMDFPTVTNDGYSIARQIKVEDEIVQLGVGLIQQVSKKVNDEVGDGTTTATILAQAIIEEGYKRLQPNKLIKGERAVDLKQEIQDACFLVVEKLKALARPVKDRQDIYNVALVSVENKETAEKLTDLMEKIGKDSFVNVEESNSFEITTEVVAGTKIDSGFISPYMATNNKGEATILKPLVLVTNDAVSDNIAVALETLGKAGKRDLFIFATGFSQTILPDIIQLKIQGKFNIVCVEIHGSQTDTLEDIAAITGAKYFDVAKDNIEEVTLEDFGSADKIISKKDNTIIVGTKDISEYIEKINIETTSAFDKEKLSKRISNLTGKVGIVRVGAYTESERIYLKLKIDDSIAAIKAAMKEGVVKGGGLTLLEISKEIDGILKEPLQAPYKQLVENGGEFEVSEDIIDPVMVTRVAIETACSLAGIVLTTEVAINEREKKNGKELD